jgi:hypothetical protein
MSVMAIYHQLTDQFSALNEQWADSITPPATREGKRLGRIRHDQKPFCPTFPAVQLLAQTSEVRMRTLKAVLYAAFTVLLVVAALALVAWEYGSPVSRKGLSDLKATSNAPARPTIVSVDGHLISSSLAVSSVKQRRKGRCIVVIVRQGIVRRGRTSGGFHMDVTVPDDVDEIAFGNSRDVIWHR